MVPNYLMNLSKHGNMVQLFLLFIELSKSTVMVVLQSNFSVVKPFLIRNF